MYSITIRCLDDFNAKRAQIVVRQFDGEHWEEAIHTFNPEGPLPDS